MCGGILKAVKSWLKHNGRKLERNIRIKDLGVPITLEQREEKAPEPSQINDILAAATTRGKVSISLMAYGGVRPEVLGDVLGTNGLVLGDLLDLNINTLEFESKPCQVIVRRDISKIKHQYFTFLNSKGCDYVLAYLKQRIKEGEKLSAKSAVIRADMVAKLKTINVIHKLGKKESDIGFFICTRNVEDEVRRAIRRAGYPYRPYILRVFFASWMQMAQLKHEVDEDAKSFWLGHMGPMSRRYSLNKHKLPQEIMDAFRKEYLNADKYLVGLDSADVRKEFESQLERRLQEERLATLELIANSIWGAEVLYENKARALLKSVRDLTIAEKIEAISEALRRRSATQTASANHFYG